MISIVASIKKMAVLMESPGTYWAEQLRSKFDIQTDASYDPLILRQVYYALSEVPTALIKDCGISFLKIRDDLGPNRAFSPNHGYFIDHTVALNSDIFYHPDRPEDFEDSHGYGVYRPAQTIFHEYGHGFDFHHEDLNKQEHWMKLSGWSIEPKPGLARLRIKEKGTPEVIGEYYFDPKAKFVRFYAKRNPWDDFADTFSFYLAGLKDKIPGNKLGYLDNLLRHYYK